MVAFAPNVGSNSLNDPQIGLPLVTELAAKHDIVIVSFHGGAEGNGAEVLPFAREIFAGEDRGNVVEFAHAMIDAGADLVLGHGPHVVRPLELYHDRLIAYSLGNFATYYGISVEGIRGIAPILLVTLDDEGKFVTGPHRADDPDSPGGSGAGSGEGRDQTAAVTDCHGISRTASLAIDDDGRLSVRAQTRSERRAGRGIGLDAENAQCPASTYSASSVMLRKSTPSERSLRYRCVRSMPTRLASWPTLPLHSSSCCCR